MIGIVTCIMGMIWMLVIVLSFIAFPAMLVSPIWIFYFIATAGIIAMAGTMTDNYTTRRGK